MVRVWNDSVMRGEDKMTIEELKEALERIPPTNAINRARRVMIQKQIYELMEKEGLVVE